MSIREPNRESMIANLTKLSRETWEARIRDIREQSHESSLAYSQACNRELAAQSRASCSEIEAAQEADLAGRP